MSVAVQVVTYMGMLGIPSITALITWCVKQIMRIRKEDKKKELKMQSDMMMLMKAHQISLRKILMDDYKKYKRLNCIKDEDLQMWMDMYDQYHGLGANGIMDKRREEILDLEIVDHYPIIRKTDDEDDGK